MDFYSSISKGYDELYGEEQLSKLSIIKKNIKISKGAKLLDVGCGTGISSDFDCFVVGVDKSIGLIKQNKRLRVVSAAESLPFKSHSFDYVISVTSLHNFSDIRKSIEEMKRVGRQYFVFSILKKSKKFGGIKRLLESSFKIDEVVEESKDTIFLLRNYKKQSFIYTK